MTKLTADRLAADVLRRARSGNRRAHVPPLPADQLAAIENGAPLLPQSADGWTLADDPELFALLERCSP